jgi:TonB-dependent SusC/RagA subfamily outer membrane receptor
LSKEIHRSSSPIIYLNDVRLNETNGANPLDSIDPTTIGSIVVLKGPAAVTKYGPDAENGVIAITTKKAPPKH